MSESMVLQKQGKKYCYTRTTSTEYTNLCKKITQMYGYTSIITPSGLSALSILLMTLCNKHNNLNIVYSNEMYCDTERLILHLKNQYNFTIINISPLIEVTPTCRVNIRE